MKPTQSLKDEHEVQHEVWNYEDECFVPNCEFGDLSELLFDESSPALMSENYRCEEEEDVGFLFDKLGFGDGEENEGLDMEVVEEMEGWDEMQRGFMDESEMKHEMDLVEMITSQTQ